MKDGAANGPKHSEREISQGDDDSKHTMLSFASIVQINYCTCCLVVKSHHVAADAPQWKRVVVGRLHTLPFWVDTTQGLAVVLQEVLGAALSWRLVLNEGADLFVAVTVCREKKREDESGSDSNRPQQANELD